MSDTLTRRGFLKLSAISFAGFGLPIPRPHFPIDELVHAFGVGRVTTGEINIYKEPSIQAPRIRKHRRDELINLFDEVISPYGPVYNHKWYRVSGGYAHSAYLQRVENARINSIPAHIPSTGQLAEVTVPFFHTMRPVPRTTRWEKLYRIYYESVHWVTGISEGPDKKPWYEITNERLRVKYYAPATHLRLIPAHEITPLSPSVPDEDKRILVNIDSQSITAFEGSEAVFYAPISTGVRSTRPPDNGIPTETPLGRFYVARKMPSRHMGDGNITSDYLAYELVGVPWAIFFVSTGVAFHGTYWHNNFGVRMSRGCVNLRNEDAKWLFRWTMPSSQPRDWYVQARGTVIDVI
jgi:lipoprotein-anchoring transpeptidase ErfK/SrfK